MNSSSNNSSIIFHGNSRNVGVSNFFARFPANPLITISPKSLPNNVEGSAPQHTKGKHRKGNPVFSKQYVANFFSVSLSTINRLIARGDLRVVKVGRSVRITKAELDSFIERQGSSNEG